MDEMKKQECKNIDLPEGFKITELGPLPEDWQVVRLGDELIEQKQKNRNEQSLPVYTISNVYGFILSDEFFEKQVYSRNLTNYKIVEKGDFAYNPYRVNVGSLALFRGDNPGLVSPAYTVFRVRSSDRLDPDFLLMLFKSSSLRSEIDRVAMSRGSVRRSLAYKDLSDFHIPLPPLPEQRAIAHVLRTVQRAKEATERVIQATQELKKSLMRYLFTYGPVPVEEAERVPLKETEIGLVPEHWEVVKLENCLSLIRNGISKKQNATSKTGYPVTRIETISEDRINPDKVGYIDNLTPTEVEKFSLRPGDILFSHINSEPQIGRSVIYEGWPSTLLHGMNLLLLRTNSNTIPYWLNYLFMHYRAIGIFIKIAARAVNQSSINQSKMKSLPIPLPPLPEQHEIARILQAVDKKLQAEEARKQALEALFKTLLNNLMTGKIRVKDVVLPNVGEGKGDVTH
jgi:type I restriction enzyme S subunit